MSLSPLIDQVLQDHEMERPIVLLSEWSTVISDIHVGRCLDERPQLCSFLHAQLLTHSTMPWTN